MYRVNKDIVSSIKGKVYAKKGDIVDVFVNNGDLVMCDHIVNGKRKMETFYCNRKDLEKI